MPKPLTFELAPGLNFASIAHIKRRHTFRRVAASALLTAGLVLSVPVGAANASESKGDAEDQGTSARFDVTSDVLADPGTYVLGGGLALQTQRELVNVAQPSGRITTLERTTYVTTLQGFGLYSLTRRLDLFTSISGRRTTTQTGTGTITGTSESDSAFDRWLTGLRYQWVEEGRSPGLRLLLNLTAAEQAAEVTYFRGARASLQIHRNVDPVNLELQARYRYSATRERDVEGATRDFDPGDRSTLAMVADFVVNDRVVLLGRLGLTHVQRARVDETTVETTRLRTPFRLGLRYGITPATNIETRLQVVPQVDIAGLELTLSRNF